MITLQGIFRSLGESVSLTKKQHAAEVYAKGGI